MHLAPVRRAHPLSHSALILSLPAVTPSSGLVLGACAGALRAPLRTTWSHAPSLALVQTNGLGAGRCLGRVLRGPGSDRAGDGLVIEAGMSRKVSLGVLLTS